VLVADDIIIDPEESPMVPARTPLSLSELGISVVEFRPGDSSIDGTSIRTAQGQRLVDRRGKAGTVEITLEVGEDEDVDLPRAAYLLQQKFGSMQERETWIMRVPYVGGDFAGPLLYKITGVVSLGDFGGWGKGEQPDVKLVLERDPVGYSTEEVESEVFDTAAGARELIYTLPPSIGTAKGLKRVRVTNESDGDLRGLIWAEECRDAPDDLEDPTAALAYRAVELTPQGGAAVSAGPTSPVVRAVGGVASGNAGISPGLPAGTEVGDLLIMVAESGGASAFEPEANTPLTAAGWSSPPAPYASQKKGNTRLTILYRIATGSDPTTTNDTGDHQVARIIGIKSETFDAAEPFNTAAVGTQAATKAVSIPGGTTTRDRCLIFACASGNLPDATGTAEFGAATNASLSELTERIDNTVTAGDGGAIYAVTGVKAAKGAYSATTLTAVTEAERGVISLAINPQTTFVEHSTLTEEWTSVLSFQIAGGDYMTHRGARSVWARVEDPGEPADEVQLQLLWRALGSSRWVEDNPVVPTYVGGEASLLELGLSRPQVAVLGDERWEGKLMARAVGGSGAIRLLDVYPLPTEQLMKLSESGDPRPDGQPSALPGTGADDASVGTVAWKTPEGIKTESVEGASIELTGTAKSHYLKATNFGLPLPLDAIPIGVVVSVRKTTSAPVAADYEVHLVKAGSVVTTENKARLGEVWDGDQVSFYGNEADLWGETLSYSDVTDPGFGVVFAVQGAGFKFFVGVSWMRLGIYYLDGADTNRVCFAGCDIDIRSDGVFRQVIGTDVWGPVVPDGFLPVALPGGLEGRPSRGILIPTQGDLKTLPDSGTPNKASAVVFERPGHLFAREGA
jgi:hypothetical protein